MPRYRLLERPLPPGLTTLRDYALRIGYSVAYIRLHWRKRAGFPSPAGELPSRGRHGGGRGEPVYEEKALEAFRAVHADLWGRRRMRRVVTSRDLDERITPGEFARELAGPGAEAEMSCLQPLDGFPGISADGTCRLGDLLAYWNTRPITLPGQDLDQEITLGEVARLLGWDNKTVSQYRDHAGFPGPVRDAGTRHPKYRLGSVLDFLGPGRPGKRGPASRTAA